MYAHMHHDHTLYITRAGYARLGTSRIQSCHVTFEACPTPPAPVHSSLPSLGIAFEHPLQSNVKFYVRKCQTLLKSIVSDSSSYCPRATSHHLGNIRLCKAMLQQKEQLFF